MPRDDHAAPFIYQQRRSTSAVRGGARYAPYTADCAGLKPHASCPEFYPSSANNSLSSPEDPSEQLELSSTVTLVNSTFDLEKADSPFDVPSDKSSKLFYDKKQKSSGRSNGFQQKKIDHFVLLIDVACKISNEIWPQSTIPTVFRLQSGAAYGYSPDTRGHSVEDFPTTQRRSDLVSLKKFITELLKRSRSTAATFQTALCYLEAVRTKIPELQQAEIEGKGTRGEPVTHAIGRVSVAPEFLAAAEEENKKLAQNNGKCKLRKPHAEPSFPLPDLPSPLLCPRRTLMGALVLAAKFVQDKCYSNRAWAKLCGLPPREVSRCERALGDALGWRLWVGRDQLSNFGGFESKLERAPTAVLIGNFGEEPKLTSSCVPVSELKVTPLARSQTWPVPCSRENYVVPAALQPLNTEIFMSPVPSLTNSSGSGSDSSSCSSGNLSPDPSPLSLFVSNDPSSNAFNKLRVSNLIHSDTVICEPFTYGLQRRDEAVFDMRVGSGQEVVF